MVRETVSRRSLLAAIGAGTTASVAGCTGSGSCRTITEGIETVERGGMRVYDVDAVADQRLYLNLQRRSGPQANLTVFDPAEEPILQLEDVDRLERVLEITEAGTYVVVTRNESTTTRAKWETTVAVYRGWCADVF